MWVAKSQKEPWRVGARFSKYLVSLRAQKRTFCLPFFVQDQDIEIFLNLNNRHQDTKQNYLLFELKMDNSSLELDLKILLRVWKVTGTFEKRTPGQDHMLSTSSKNTLIVLLALTQGHRDIIVWSMFLADKGIRI